MENNQGWIGDALSGMGAGLSGKGVQWQQAQTLAKREKRELDLQEQEMRVKAGFTDLITRKSMADAGDWGGVLNQLQNRHENLQSLTPMPGGNDDDTRIQLQLAQIAVGDGPDAMEARKQLMSGMDQGMELGVGLGYLSGTTGNKIQFGDSHVFKDAAGNLFQGTQRRNPRTGEVESALSPVGHNNPQVGQLSKVDNLGLTAPQVVQQAQNLAKATETGKGAGTLGAEVVRYGYDAAKGLPTIRRSIDLMNRVETGGIDAMQVAAKQMFGIESADEAELENLFSKAVIVQLKESFGGSFSVQEGEWLKKAEAEWGKSTAGNKRILAQWLKKGEKYVDIAIQRATNDRDYDTVSELIELKKFTLDDDVSGNASPSRAASPGANNGYQVISVD